MSSVTYVHDGGIATITLDDGKVNALSPTLFEELNAAVDQALADDAVIVLTGREGVFSAGFDLKTVRAGDQGTLDLVRSGFEMSERLLSHPRPVIVASSGHAVAMGAFLVLSGDLRIGVIGDTTIVANEVAIGMILPRAAIEVLRQRLTPAAFVRSTLLAEPFSPQAAVAAGFFDLVVDPGDLARVTQAKAEGLLTLDRHAHAGTKAKVRAPFLATLREAIEADHAAGTAFLAG